MLLHSCDYLGMRTLELHGLSDIHVGSPEFNEVEFTKRVKTIQNTSNAAVLLVGDILDCVYKSSKGDVYHQALTPSQQVKKAAELLMPIKDKIIGIVGGNHDTRRSEEDYNPIEHLCEKLQVTYFGQECLLKLRVGANPSNHGKPQVYTIYATHGWANSRQAGGRINALTSLGNLVIADMYMTGHTHAEAVVTDQIYVPDLRNEKVVVKERFFVNLGAWQDRGDYPKSRGMAAKRISSPVAVLSGWTQNIKVIV